MIYELITLTAANGAMKDLLTHLQTQSPNCPAELLAAWATEVGAINDVLILRRYADANQATEFKPGGGGWLDAALPLLVDARIEHFRLLPDSPPVEPGKIGALHELRAYQYRPGKLDDLIENWKPALVRRRQASPGPIAMYSINGNSRRFLHLWVYDSYEDRLRIRAEEVAKGYWPPPGGKARWTQQDNSLLQPLPFSPMQ